MSYFYDSQQQSAQQHPQQQQWEDLVPQCSIQQYLRFMVHKRTANRSSADNLVSSSANRSS